MDWIVYLFVILVLVYLFCHRKVIVRKEQALFAIGLAMLVGTYFHKKRQASLETYVDMELGQNPLSTVEDLIWIRNLTTTTVYLTLFSPESWKRETDTSRQWYNVANPSTSDCNNKALAEYFTFENRPVYSLSDGVTFGTNRLYGPNSNDLGISLQSTFTIFMCLKHGEFSAETKREVELLKLYANSENNNGLALYIRAGSIEIANNVQKAELMFRFTDDEQAIPCKLNDRDDGFVFDRLNPSFFFIIKELDKIRVVYMVGGSSVIRTICTVNIKETSATFSNKELVINRFQNYKGSMYSFGIRRDAIPDNEIANIYNHIYNEYLKSTSDDYVSLVKSYNEMLENLRNFNKCPFNKEACEKCTTVTKWTDSSQIISAPQDCKTAIHAYCKANPKHALCKCWDSTFSDYNAQSCIMYRQIFDPNANIANSLKQEDLDKLKSQFGLINVGDCPKPTAVDAKKEEEASCALGADGLLKNVYSDYDLDKLQVKFNSTTTTSNPYKVAKVYNKDPAVQSELEPPSSNTSVTIGGDVNRRGITNPYTKGVIAQNTVAGGVLAKQSDATEANTAAATTKVADNVTAAPEIPKELAGLVSKPNLEPPKDFNPQDIPDELRKFVVSSKMVNNPYPPGGKSIQALTPQPVNGGVVSGFDKNPIKPAVRNPYDSSEKLPKEQTPISKMLSLFLPTN